jgi:hypothetical protein
MLAWPGWTRRINEHFPLRYLTWMLCGLLALFFAISWTAGLTDGVLALVFLGLALLGLRDVRQQRHSILRNYPVIGHLRFLLEFIRPEIRQYFLEGDNDAAPFSRAQRSIVYQRAKGAPDQRPFGTQLDTGARGYEWINHSLMPTHLTSHDFRITIGAGRPQPYSASVFNISAMSFGALSANAILALNKGAKLGGFAHDTGEGSISVHHRANGGDLIWEVGSGYFGCRNDDGSFSPERFQANAIDPQVKMIELKLSQGAKPGHGGVPQGDRGDRRRARRAGRRGLHLAGTPQRLLDAGRDDAVHRAAAHAVGWQAHRLQALHRPSVGVVRRLQGHAGDRHQAGLHRRRRRRGRHGRRAAGVHQPCRRTGAGRAAAGA